jgi:hypothetical protein
MHKIVYSHHPEPRPVQLMRDRCVIRRLRLRQSLTWRPWARWLLMLEED